MPLDPDLLLHSAAQALKGGDLKNARTNLERLLDVVPEHGQALYLLSILDSREGNHSRAAALAREATRVDPTRLAYHLALGAALRKSGRVDDAKVVGRESVGRFPESGEALFNLGVVRQESDDDTGAINCYKRCLALTPAFAAAHNNCATVLKNQGQLSEALTHLQAAVDIDPASPGPRVNIAGVQKDMGLIDDAIDSYRAALSRATPDCDSGENSAAWIHSNLLFCLNYSENYTPAQLLTEHRRFSEQHEPRSSAQQLDINAGKTERKTRIGLVSEDFRRHSVGFFIEPVLEALAELGGDVEVFCYSDVAKEDEFTARMRLLSVTWRRTYAVSDLRFAEIVQADTLDVAVDLAGHTGRNRLMAFARRLAPVQITYLGYPHTTGLAAIDFRVTDDVADPIASPDPDHETDAVHTEQLLRVPGGFLCYRPPADAPVVAAMPGAARGFITFGSFNNLSKLTPDVLCAWAAILANVPNSRLLLKARSLADEPTRARVAATFLENGLAAKRLDLRGFAASTASHLEQYSEIDVALDPFPYNGTTTTIEALWMGVPVVAICGDRHASRVSASILTHCGHPELITDSKADYVALATSLAGDPSRLLALRGSLRKDLASSSLLDASEIAHKLAFSTAAIH